MKTSLSLPKIDLGARHKKEYAAPKKPVLLTIAPATYLAISGRGAPGDAEFSTKIGALYAMAYTVKMTRKFSGQQDYTIGRLEAQYWMEGRQADFGSTPRERWHWQLLIRTPECVEAAELKRAAAALRKKGKPVEVDEVALVTVQEGECVQMLHLGPYERIGDSVGVMQRCASERDRRFQGRHHEIYLSDPRRVAPEKLKTILREPVQASR
jgi:hypothetical protein